MYYAPLIKHNCNRGGAKGVKKIRRFESKILSVNTKTIQQNHVWKGSYIKREKFSMPDERTKRKERMSRFEAFHFSPLHFIRNVFETPLEKKGSWWFSWGFWLESYKQIIDYETLLIFIVVSFSRQDDRNVKKARYYRIHAVPQKRLRFDQIATRLNLNRSRIVASLSELVIHFSLDEGNSRRSRERSVKPQLPRLIPNIPQTIYMTKRFMFHQPNKFTRAFTLYSKWIRKQRNKTKELRIIIQ